MLALETRAGDTAAGKARDECCPRCGLHVGSWRLVGGKPEFHPRLAAMRRLAYGDGWLRLNCKRCDARITLDHGGRAA